MSQCGLARQAGRAGCVGYHYLLHTLSYPGLYAIGLAVMCHHAMDYRDIPDRWAAWKRACAKPLEVLEKYPNYSLSLSPEGWQELVYSLQILSVEVLQRLGNFAIAEKIFVARLEVEEEKEVVRVLSAALLLRTVLLEERQGMFQAVDLAPIDGHFWVLLGVDERGNYYHFTDRYFLKGWERPGFPYYCTPGEESPIRVDPRAAFNLENPAIQMLNLDPAIQETLDKAFQFISNLSTCSLPPAASESRDQLLQLLRSLPLTPLVASAIQALERMVTRAISAFEKRVCKKCQTPFDLSRLRFHGNPPQHIVCSRCIRTYVKCPICAADFEKETVEWANSPSERDSQV